jgi:hypothetical protein
VTLFDFLSLKTDVSVPSKSNKQKKLFKKLVFLLAFLRSMMKIAGSGSTPKCKAGHKDVNSLTVTVDS